MGWRDKVEGSPLGAGNGGGGGGGAGKTVYLSNLGEDAAATIQAALNSPRVSCVVLPAGEIGIGSTITIPTGKTLMGAGKELTTLVALEDFHSTAGVPFPGVMVFASGAKDVTLSGLTLDGAKVGLTPTGDIAAKVSGVVMYNTTGFLVQDVHVENVTGYAQWAVGSWNHYSPRLSTFSSGEYIDCSTANANVHFEQTTAGGIHILRSFSSDGDGDIPTEAYLHPLVGSYDIVYEDVVVRGTGDGVGALVVSLGVPIGSVTFINPDIVTQNAAMSLYGSQFAPVGMVAIQGGSVESTANIGIIASWVTNISITGASITGHKIGIIEYDGSITGINSSIQAAIESLDGASYALVHSGIGTAVWSGPLISTSTNGPEFSYSGVVEWFYDGAYRDYLGAALPDTGEVLTAAADGQVAVAADSGAAEPQGNGGSNALEGRPTGALPEVLADALVESSADIDALLTALVGQSPAGPALAYAGNGDAVASWAMPGPGPFTSGGAFEAIAFHQDAAPPA